MRRTSRQPMRDFHLDYGPGVTDTKKINVFITYLFKDVILYDLHEERLLL